MTVVGFAFLFFIGVKLATDSAAAAAPAVKEQETTLSAGTEVLGMEAASSTSPDLDSPNPTSPTADRIVYPYDKFTLTQGPHGYSYGHMAIDLTAGLDAPIFSPIAGVVSASFVDPYGNPTLVLENTRYEVTLLHGHYTVEPGDKVELGQPVGSESNLGYTTDWQGRSCKERDCGYHTHLNIYDKSLGHNVNPLEILEFRHP